jgi:hypothetical protein
LKICKVSFSSPSSSFLLRPDPAFAARPTRLAQPANYRGPARFFTRAQPSFRRPRSAQHHQRSPVRLPPPCVADRWGRVVIPFLGSASSRARAAPWLCAGRAPAPPAFLGPVRPGRPLGLLSHCHRSSLGFLPPNRSTAPQLDLQTLAAPPRRRSEPPPPRNRRKSS